MNLYAPIVALLGLTAGFMAIAILISTVLGPNRKNKAKYEPYECGVEATPQPLDGGRIPIKYYLTAMLFIVFDIEIVFLYPWAVSYHSMGIFAVVEMVLFIVTVFIAYVYVLRRGGLNWE
ncbi:MAG: NADH-quinone oxidoreductase subunit A [Propionibacteriaceae bacterium]|nr:NADH-quinone oxidoreductase subunit A [Propionibacteriaceae bacterium]